jgi:small subunit ribosomal protein S8
MKNYLWNMFANLKNGQLAKKNFIYQTRKKICESFLKIMWDEGLILGYTIDPNNSNLLKIFLKYKNNKPVINTIKIISKPSKRIYWSINQIWKINSSKNFIILSTNKGLKSVIDCKKLKIGGEPFISLK